MGSSSPEPKAAADVQALSVPREPRRWLDVIGFRRVLAARSTHKPGLVDGGVEPFHVTGRYDLAPVSIRLCVMLRITRRW